MPLLYRLFPQYVTTTEQIGRAMLKVAKLGAPKVDTGDCGHQQVVMRLLRYLVSYLLGSRRLL